MAITATSANDAINAVSAPIATIKAYAGQTEKGIQTLQAILTILISNLANYVNVGKNMSAGQIVETINLILSDKDLAHLKIEDFKVCFDGLKRGKYIDKNKLFDRLDGQIIFEALYNYCNERCDIVEAQNIIKSGELRSEERSQKMNPEIAQILKSAIKEIPKEEKKKRISERDPRLTQWFTEFENTFKKEGIEKNGRFIKYNGKILSQMEFIEEKLKETDNG